MSTLPRYGKYSLLAVALVVCGCESKPERVWPDQPGPKILTSFGPIQCFAMNVAGDDAVVKVIWTSEGAHYQGEPTDHQLKLAAGADILFYNGLSLSDEALAAKLRKVSGNPKLTLVSLGERLDKNCLLEGACHHEGGHAPGEAHDHGTDPHVWLSPKHAKTMVEAIRDELVRLDPAHAAGYEARAAAYVAKLELLEKDGQAMLAGIEDRKLLTHHDSLAYFAECFNLRIIDYIQSSDVEPGSEKLNDIIKLCKKHSVRAIAVEPQYNRNTAASVIKAELEKEGMKPAFVEIDTLETATDADLTADYYERKMRANLENLSKARR